MGEDWFKCVAGLQVDVAFAWRKLQDSASCKQ